MEYSDPRITRKGRKIFIDGVPFDEWAKSKGFNKKDFATQLYKGLSVDEAIARYTALCARKPTVFFDGKEWSIKELLNSEHNVLKLSNAVFYNRVIANKWDVTRALTEPLKTVTRDLIEYDQKIYRSVSHLCYALNISRCHFTNLLNDGLSIEEAVDRALGVVTIKKKYLYKGKEYTISELCNHPDNIHRVRRNTLHARLCAKNPNMEALFFPPHHQQYKSKSFTYRGKKYSSKIDFIRKHNLRRTDYNSFSKIDIKSENLEKYLDKLLAKSKNK